MPVVKLLVEGKLDVELLSAILAAALPDPPLIERRGSKDSLKPIAREESRSGLQVCFIRDRDFDFDPPENTAIPQPISAGAPPRTVGWHWSRHEIENYLLEPSLFCTAIPGAGPDVYLQKMSEAAVAIRFYQAARWAVGVARRTLPPHFELRTRPDELEDREIAVPADCSESATGQWAIQTAGGHLEAVTSSLAQTAVQEVFRAQCDLFDSSLCADPSRVLVWFSGKDLLAALEGWWTELGFENAGACRAHVRDWVRAHPGKALALLPEWQALAEAVRQL